MTRPSKLAPEQVSAALALLPEWTMSDGKLSRQYKFEDFTHAFGFMAAAATVAEKLDHHTDWLNVYNRVTIHLVTHDVGGITELDFKLAEAMERIARKLV